jgi:tol-pal system protein YbgF
MIRRGGTLKNSLFLIPALLLAFVVGCATTDDLRRVQGNLNEKLVSLQEENANLRKEIESSQESIKPIRKLQADTGADLIEIRDSLQALKGASEEIRRDINLLKSERKERDPKINELLLRINFIENFIGIGKKGEPDEESKKEGKPTSGTAPSGNGKSDREGVYTNAYKEFKDGKYEEARRDFQKFLDTYPKAEYSDNAQFWLGECYYVEGKYEKAILEYEKVIKNFSTSEKVPHALLKQGLSFLKLKDKASAKLILQQVIKDYPNTNQARIARARLAEIQ